MSETKKGYVFVPEVNATDKSLAGFYEAELVPPGEGIVPFTGYKCVHCPDWIGESAEDVVNHLATEYHQQPHDPDAFWDDIAGQWVAAK